MNIRYISRAIEPILKKAIAEFPAIVLTGPRQSGKTTLLKHLFMDEYRYVSLELPDVRTASMEDPRSFLEQYKPPVIMDEIQYAPGLLPYIKEAIDENRSRAGQYILTGSQNIMLSQKISESLAGRAVVLRLMPLSWREEDKRIKDPLPWEDSEATENNEGKSFQAAWKRFLRGGYPELVANPERDISLWISGYIHTYFERDVRSLRQVGDLTQFQIFLRMLAARSAQLLNLTDLSNDIGISVNTVKAWISVLEATHQIFILRPYHTNIGKRLVKTPKIYFSDTGILCHLTGIKDTESLSAGPMAGPVLEAAVIAEIIKILTHRGEEPRIYFWRTSTGEEVDIILESGGKLIPIEVKSSATPKPAMGKQIRSFRENLGDMAMPGYLIHPGDIRLPLGDGVTALPLSHL